MPLSSSPCSLTQCDLPVASSKFCVSINIELYV